jgi:two-component system, sensor histidine kinase
MHDGKVNILLVDDKPENLLSLEALLGDLGDMGGQPVNLVKAHSGTEALKCVLKDDFALILMDVQMPGMDGFETVDLIKERDRSKHTPIIFLTALSKSDVYISRGYSVGAVDYILKPIVPEILRSKVAVFVDLFQKTEEVKRLNQELEARVVERTAQLQEAVNELHAEIAERKRLEAQKDEFIAVASHELRTPLTTIKGYTKLALRSAENLRDEKLVRTLSIVSEKTEQLTRLMNEMLDVSRIENDVLPLELSTFDLGELIKEIIRGLELIAPEFRFDLELPGTNGREGSGIRDRKALVVRADRQRIEQVVTNLLENAIKYTGKADVQERKIEVNVTTNEDEIVVTVRDHGVGIPADQQSQVFSRFFRASNVTSAKYPYPGMGLGLFISQGIVQRHGGKIWVESSADEGSTFSFSLPCRDAHATTVAEQV